jgi:hypothetical protein
MKWELKINFSKNFFSAFFFHFELFFPTKKIVHFSRKKLPIEGG